MNRFQRSSMRGVTLLEIMLVLAIAAMIIVMSIRYYRSASTSQQVNSTLSQIQGITSAADNIASAKGTYADVNNTNIQALLGENNMLSATGAPIKITAGGTANTYSVEIQISPDACTAVALNLGGNSKLTGVNCADGTLTYTYDSTK